MKQTRAMKRTRALAAMALASVVLAGCDETVTGPRPIDPSRPSDSRDASFQWQGLVDRGDRLEVLGINGNIRAVVTPGNEVEVTAVKTGRKSHVSDVVIEVVEHAEGVTICARYPDFSGRLSSCVADDSWEHNTRITDVEVAFTVHVPEDVVFVGRTVNGEVRATDLRSDTFARTVNGNIWISTDGLAEGFTVNGSITASIGRAHWDRDLRFSTVNGSVTLAIPAGTDAEVYGGTANGNMSTDFPLTIKALGFSRTLRGTLGRGGWSLRLSTVHGNISLNHAR